MWPPDVQVTTWRFPDDPSWTALPSAHWSVGDQNKHAAPVQPQSPSAQVADVACRCSALFICAADYSCHWRMWSIRFDFLGLSKNCLSTLVPAPWNTGLGGCDYSQITRGGFWKHKRKKRHEDLKTNVHWAWEEGEAKATRKLVWIAMSSAWWWWCASCRMTLNGQCWQSERSYLETGRVMQHSIYPGTNVRIPDTSLSNI